ncbi:MAG TPA: radical SAM protein [Bacteroidetes bacterium]|nr:radical SAM protein [Bacteroidota bacterium]
MSTQHPPRLPTAGQLLNLALAYLGAGLSRLVRRPVVLGAPAMLMVEPTTACQLRCPHCALGRGELTRPAARLTLEEFRRIWDAVRPAPALLQLWNQGEPLLNPEIAAIIRHAASSGARVVLSTNVEPLEKELLAAELVDAGLHELILSLDGATAESHLAYRTGGSFEKVERGVRNIVAVRRERGVRHPKLTWQFILFRHNLPEADEAKRLARRWGVDRVVFKTAQLEDTAREEGERWLPEEPRLRRYDLRGDRWVLRRGAHFFCDRIYTSATVLADGRVVPCCFDKDGSHVLGNALEQPFPEVWRGRAYQAFRRRMLTADRPGMCGNCTEGLRNLEVKP